MASFQLKNFASISASMINWLRATQTTVTDFTVGSVTRTLIEAPATELEELYQQMFNGLLNGIQTAVFTSFNFPPLVAAPAGGLIAVIIATQLIDTLIAAGATFTASSANAQQYGSTIDVTIPAGQTNVNVPVEALTSGSAGNIQNDTSFTMTPSPPGFTAATNGAAFINGIDNETPAAHLIRFNSYVSTLQKGTNAAIIYGAMTANLQDANGNVIEQVKSAVVIEPYLANNALPISSINCYIHNGVGGTSSALVSQAQLVINGYTDANGNQIPGYKSAGVVCTVAAATEQPLSVTGVLTAAPGYDQPTLVTAALAALTAYLLGLPTGQTAQFNLISAAVTNITGVGNFVISTPTADTTVAANVKIMPGTLTIP